MSCPICNRETVTKYRPFCSRRCADIDLGKWFDGSYSVPVPGDLPDVDAENEDESATRSGPRPH